MTTATALGERSPGSVVDTREGTVTFRDLAPRLDAHEGALQPAFAPREGQAAGAKR
ncbi:hypothetical protein [Sorangium sp. So ce1024]|uniref:hypothetical protein n=1 Tax=unclassified Sorangium TaxID=2621164 RepID=UPI003F09AA47